MKNISVILAVGLLIVWVGWWVQASKKVSQNPTQNKVIDQKTDIENLPSAIFAWGCFWCIEWIFDGTTGVAEAVSGYIGGTAETATYDQIGTGKTEHREWVKVYYDPDTITFSELVDIFWRQIDPTDEWGQFADRGFQYTTAMYYANDEEQQILKASKKELNESGKFEKEIATKILPVSDFYEAEEYHQDYAQKQTLRYKAYEVGSWRAGYKKETWSEEEKEAQAKMESENQKNTMTKQDLKDRLTPLQYRVTQEDGTERAFTEGNYHDNKEAWIYVDIVDGTPLYSSLHKYDSWTGWPSFWQWIDDDMLVYKEDNSFFSKRTEVRSKIADSHLGHIFPDGPSDKWWIRHCINGASLEFIPVDQLEARWYAEYLESFE